jgi:hypothetical protein
MLKQKTMQKPTEYFRNIAEYDLPSALSLFTLDYLDSDNYNVLASAQLADCKLNVPIMVRY